MLENFKFASKRGLKRFLSPCLVGGLVAFTILPSHAEEPDIDKEKFFHEIYKNFNSAPTDINVWSEAKKGKTEQINISKSDTLWSISEILFGDPNFWPKIWSLNSEKIENPHQIYPNQLLNFTAGSLTQPPTLTLGDNQIPASTPEAQVLSEQQLMDEKVVPAPELLDPVATADAISSEEIAEQESEESEEKDSMDPKIKELMGLANIPIEKTVELPPSRPIPNSLPPWSFGRRIPRLDIEVKPVTRVPPPADEPLRYFVSKEEISGLGKIAGSEMGHITGADFQYMDLKLDPQESGKHFYVISSKGKVKDLESGEKAFVYQIEGEVEKLDIVNSRENIYRGMVTRTILPLQKSSILIPGKPPVYKNSPSEMASGKATLIGGEQDTVRRLLHTGALVFLKGTDLAEGSSYPIYRKNSIRVDDTLEFENPRKIGSLKVVQISEDFATGVITSANEEIHVGDVTDPSLINLD